MREPVELTPGQYKTKTAYHIDPLMAAVVVVVQPTWRSRINGEMDTADVRPDPPRYLPLRRRNR